MGNPTGSLKSMLGIGSGSFGVFLEKNEFKREKINVINSFL